MTKTSLSKQDKEKIKKLSEILQKDAEDFNDEINKRKKEMSEDKKFKIPTTGYGADGKIHKFPNPGKEIRNECIARDNAFYDSQKKNQKFEKVEKMAWELFKGFIVSPQYLTEHWESQECLEDAWKQAEKFYDYVKRKQEEANEDQQKVTDVAQAVAFHQQRRK